MYTVTYLWLNDFEIIFTLVGDCMLCWLGKTRTQNRNSLTILGDNFNKAKRVLVAQNLVWN
jgi:hypothetical protein